MPKRAAAEEVGALRSEVDTLKENFEEFRKQFE